MATELIRPRGAQFPAEPKRDSSEGFVKGELILKAVHRTGKRRSKFQWDMFLLCSPFYYKPFSTLQGLHPPARTEMWRARPHLIYVWSKRYDRD